MWSRPACPIGPPEIAPGAAEELLGLFDPRLRQDHRELVAADPARDVGGANHLAHALSRLGEHRVAGEMPDLVVHVLEVVEVEDDQREPPVVAVRTLARERLVEVPPVVEPGQRVEIGELPRLAEALGVLDRRRGSLRQLLRAGGQPPPGQSAGRGPSCRRGRWPTPAAVVLERDGESAGDQAPPRLLPRGPTGRQTSIARARAPSGGPAIASAPSADRPWAATSSGRLPGSRGGSAPHRPPPSGCRPRASAPAPRPCRSSRRSRPRKPASPALLLGPLDRPGELGRELVHPLLERLDDCAHALVGPVAARRRRDTPRGRCQNGTRPPRALPEIPMTRVIHAAVRPFGPAWPGPTSIPSTKHCAKLCVVRPEFRLGGAGLSFDAPSRYALPCCGPVGRDIRPGQPSLLSNNRE